MTVEVEEPTLDDYREAEHRAAFHLAPQARDSKSDEMRDLIIWTVAIRIASRDGGAILVSRDNIHVGPTGSHEAVAAGLQCVGTFDEALELLGRFSQVGRLVRSVLNTIWEDLMLAGLPLPVDIPSRGFSDVQFVSDDAGHTNTRLRFRMATEHGVFSGSANVFQADSMTVQIDLADLLMNDTRWETGARTITARRELPIGTRPLNERMSELRKIIGGETGRTQ